MEKPNTKLIIVWVVLIGIFSAALYQPYGGARSRTGPHLLPVREQIVNVGQGLLLVPMNLPALVGLALLSAASVNTTCISENSIRAVGALVWALVLLAVLLSGKQFFRRCAYGLAVVMTILFILGYLLGLASGGA